MSNCYLYFLFSAGLRWMDDRPAMFGSCVYIFGLLRSDTLGSHGHVRVHCPCVSKTVILAGWADLSLVFKKSYEYIMAFDVVFPDAPCGPKPPALAVCVLEAAVRCLQDLCWTCETYACVLDTVLMLAIMHRNLDLEHQTRCVSDQTLSRCLSRSEDSS
jgi:hypothetical protein